MDVTVTGPAGTVEVRTGWIFSPRFKRPVADDTIREVESRYETKDQRRCEIDL